MFRNDKNQLKKGDRVVNKVDQDLIVHNMPNKSRLSGSSVAAITNQDFSGSNVKQHNVKSIGAIIIVLGVILVGALVYLSYRFVIKPQAEKTPVAQVNKPASISQTTETELTDAPIVATSSAVDIETIDPISATTSQSVATTSEVAINEEDMPEEGLVEEVLWTPILDTDGDGLTDDEESAMETNVSEIDTDKDGYLDLAEIKSGYNPLNTGRLNESTSLAIHNDMVSKFSILYPVSWIKQSLNSGYTLIISAPDNSLFQVSVQDNPRNQVIADWYAETFSSETDTYSSFKNGVGWEGISSKDGLDFYLTDIEKNNIYVISYIPVISTRLAYLNIYQMMIDNFKIQ